MNSAVFLACAGHKSRSSFQASCIDCCSELGGLVRQRQKMLYN